MNKSELIAAIAAKEGMEKKQAEKAVNAVTGAIGDALAKGDKVQLIGFGTFEVRARKAKKARNPQTGEVIKVPATKVPAFKPGSALKDKVAKKKAAAAKKAPAKKAPAKKAAKKK